MEAVGIPLPGETALLVGVVAASTGHLSLAGVMAAAWCSATLGGSLGYVIGRRWGTGIMAVPALRRVYRPERIAAAERLVGRFGIQAVFAGRFIPLLRIFAGPLAGMHRLSWRRYLAANTTGAALWVAAVSVVGILIGNNIGRAVAIVQRSGYVAFVVAVLAVVAIVVHHHRNP
jgi:phosphatidylglycerol lysyltransferase